MSNKVCSKCRQCLSLDHFHKETRAFDGYGAYCKDCKKTYHKQNRQKAVDANSRFRMRHRKALRESARKRYANNRDKELLRVKQYRQQHADQVKKYALTYNHSPERRFAEYKRQAQSRRLAWELSYDEFIELTSHVCNYCGQYTKLRAYCGIDRVDNTVGYVKNNCVPCCKWCNHMKRNYSQEEFIEQIKRLYKMMESR